jgi:hypothetical protein
MAKEVWYKQCVFERPTDVGLARDTAWIPEGLAKVGKLIYLTESPEEIYTVVSVGVNRRNAAHLKSRQNAQRKYMKTTDI